MSTKWKNVKQAVNDYFDSAHAGDVVYATPGTGNHSANFYGDTVICELSKQDVVACIECASDWGMNEDETIDAVLSDLQYDRPEDDDA